MLLYRSNRSEVIPCLSDERFNVEPDKTKNMIVVDVRGAVSQPGLYTVEEGSRKGDVISLAGGFTTQADGSYTRRELNLASIVQDGDKVYIPAKGELEIDQGNEVISEQANTTTTKISINKSTQNQLEQLAGIGQKRATDIISGRPYASIEELVVRKVITQKILDAIESEITL